MEKKISIIIPVYNAEMYIKRCLESIISQSYKNFEILIIDDGSKDNSVVICKKIQLANLDIDIKIFSQKNSGPSVARNFGIKNSTGKYIMFIDADDYLGKDVLMNTIQNVKNNTLIKCNYNIFTEKKVYDLPSVTGNMSKEEFIKGMLTGKYIGSVWGALFDADLAKKCDFPPEIHFLEDTLFIVKYLQKIDNVEFVEGKYYYCLGNMNSITTSKERVMSNIDSFNKALDQINKLTQNNFEKEIANKKITLIEKEIAKLETYKEVKVIVNSPEFIYIINNISLEMIDRKFYALLLKMYRKKKKVSIYVYILIRRFLKKLKKLGEK